MPLKFTVTLMWLFEVEKPFGHENEIVKNWWFLLLSWKLYIKHI